MLLKRLLTCNPLLVDWFLSLKLKWGVVLTVGSAGRVQGGVPVKPEEKGQEVGLATEGRPEEVRPGRVYVIYIGVQPPSPPLHGVTSQSR